MLMPVTLTGELKEVTIQAQPYALRESGTHDPGPSASGVPNALLKPTPALASKVVVIDGL
jgi:hypothetical protein